MADRVSSPDFSLSLLYVLCIVQNVCACVCLVAGASSSFSEWKQRARKSVTRGGSEAEPRERERKGTYFHSQSTSKDEKRNSSILNWNRSISVTNTKKRRGKKSSVNKLNNKKTEESPALTIYHSL